MQMEYIQNRKKKFFYFSSILCNKTEEIFVIIFKRNKTHRQEVETVLLNKIRYPE